MRKDKEKLELKEIEKSSKNDPELFKEKIEQLEKKRIQVSLVKD